MLRRFIAVGLAGLGLSACLSAQGAPTTTYNPGAARAVVETLKTLFVAAETDDLAKFRSLTSPGFYAFDNGKRFDGDELMKFVTASHAKGMMFVWNVTNPDVHIDGNEAWVAYTNVGSVRPSASAPPQPVTWLESAYLERHEGTWKIAFVQSERAAASGTAGEK